MSEETASDIYEEVESDSETICAYFPFIKVENDGSVSIDGQPYGKNASQMSIEAAEVLVLPYSDVPEQFENFEEIETHQVVDIAEEQDLVETTVTTEQNQEISDTLHDHNYDDSGRYYEEEDPEYSSYVVQKFQQMKRTCHLCDKVFNSPASLKRHLRTHTGERPYQCQVCEKNFSQQSNLWKHVRTHTGERPFECPDCNKKFSQRANLKKHLVVHTGERPFVCFLCGRAFTQQANLGKHMRLHTGEKPYSCSYCEKRFTQRSNLQKHEHLHEGIKPYTCEICLQAFTQQSNLRKHEMMHNNIKKFICEICNKAYVQKISLMKHKQRCGISGIKKVDDYEDETQDIGITEINEINFVPIQCLVEDENGVVISENAELIFTA